eukprot:scaffold51004_cov61-Phaeocystis_antarctica.AAC.3
MVMPEDGAALRDGLLLEDAEEAHVRALSHRGGRCGRAVQPVGEEKAHVARGHPHLCHARAARHTLLIRLHQLEYLAPESVPAGGRRQRERVLPFDAFGRHDELGRGHVVQRDNKCQPRLSVEMPRMGLHLGQGSQEGNIGHSRRLMPSLGRHGRLDGLQPSLSRPPCRCFHSLQRFLRYDAPRAQLAHARVLSMHPGPRVVAPPRAQPQAAILCQLEGLAPGDQQLTQLTA